MQKLIFMLSAVVLSHAAMAQSNILLDAAALKEKLGKKELVILHVSQEDLYKKEHIPGAQFVQEGSFTIDEGSHAFDLPPVSDLQTLFESKGVTKNSQIVIYTDGNFKPVTTRLLFTLDYLGFGNQVSILDGGLIAWKASGGKITNEVPPTIRSSLQLTPRKDLVVDKEYVRNNLGKQQTTIIDCRAAVFYQGIEVLEMHGGRKGRIPGAKSIPFASLYDKTERGSYEFKSLVELKKIFDQQGIKKGDQIILYCHIGLQLTVVYTASKLLGYDNVKVFDGSFHEWGADKSLPVELQ